MNGYMGTIDTDAGIGTILSHFSSEYIDHVIDDSLNMKFRPFDGPMPNMVDILERQFLSIYNNARDYSEKVSDVRIETYKEIIYKICNFYNLSFIGDFDSMTPEEIYGVCRIMYDIFISRFTEYMNNFFVSYIVQNADWIASSLKSDESASHPKESGVYNLKNYIDPKFVLIHANINKVIYDMTAHDITLEMMLQYFLDQNSASRLNFLLQDNINIYKNHYASYILDQRYSAGVLTNIKLKLQARTQEAYQI